MSEEFEREQVLKRVSELAAAQVHADPGAIGGQTHLFEDLNFDSLEAVEFTMVLEDEFEVSISDEQAESVRTIDDAVNLLLTVCHKPVSAAPEP